MVQSMAVFSVVEAKLSIELRLKPSDLSAVAAVCGVNVDLPSNSVTADAVEKLGKFEDIVRQRLQARRHEDTSNESALDVGRKPFRCHICSFVSVRSNHLAKHLATHNKSQELYECPEEGCDFKCIRDGTLARHKLTHAEQIFHCPRPGCKFRTVSAQLLKKHVKYKHEAVEAQAVKTETEDETLYHVCLECDYRTRSQFFFDRHRRGHERRMKSSLKKITSSPPLMRCTECTYATRKRANLDRHSSSVHGNLRRFHCQFCGTGFKRKDTMKQHLATHGAEISDAAALENEEVPNLPRCQFCDKLCRNGTVLMDHMAKTHPDLTSATSNLCHVCGVTFTTRSAAVKHVRTVHGKQEDFKCHKCSKRFAAKEALVKHLKSAAGHKEAGLGVVKEETVIYTLHLGDQHPLSVEDMRSYLVGETTSVGVLTSDGTVEISNSAETICNP